VASRPVGLMWAKAFAPWLYSRYSSHAAANGVTNGEVVRNPVGAQAMELDDRNLKSTSVVTSRLISELHCSVSRPALWQDGALHRATTWLHIGLGIELFEPESRFLS